MSSYRDIKPPKDRRKCGNCKYCKVSFSPGLVGLWECTHDNRKRAIVIPGDDPCDLYEWCGCE